MATDYNASLIPELYNASTPEIASRICDEMVEIGDPIFPRQIYEAYKKFKDTSMSHYFVADLAKFKSEEVSSIFKEIVHTTTRSADIIFALDYLSDIEYFDPEIIKKVLDLFKTELKDSETEDYEISDYFRYLEKSGRDLTELEPLLQYFFENDDRNSSARRLALKKLLKLNPKKYLSFYYENYSSLTPRAEVVFAKEVSGWENGIVPKVHEKILKDGSEAAKEILIKKKQKEAKDKEEKLQKEQKTIKEEYATADVIAEISKLRERINKTAFGDPRFGFPFFSPDENFYQQNIPAKDKDTMAGYCTVLRSLLQNFDDQIEKLEVPESKHSLLPFIQEWTGSINKFHFILIDRGIDVDDDIFGLRTLNRFTVKFAAHPKEAVSEEFIEILKKENLFDYYQDDNWPMLHREILLKYKKVLELLLESLKAE